MTERWEPRRFRWGMRQSVILIVILALLAMVAIVLVVGATFTAVGRQATDEQPEIEATATTYLQALADDDVDLAYAQVCDRVRRRITVAEFDRNQNFRSDLKSFELSGFGYRSGTDGRTATVTADVALHSGRQIEQRLALVEEDGQWRVCE